MYIYIYTDLCVKLIILILKKVTFTFRTQREFSTSCKISYPRLS